MVKYKEYVQKMLEENEEIFDSFKKLHDEYAFNTAGLQAEFNKEGKKILDIVREYENRLCNNTERGMYSKYSTGLSEKFQNEVRKLFPMIDRVGIIAETKFSIKKITLN